LALVVRRPNAGLHGKALFSVHACDTSGRAHRKPAGDLKHEHDGLGGLPWPFFEAEHHPGLLTVARRAPGKLKRQPKAARRAASARRVHTSSLPSLGSVLINNGFSIFATRSFQRERTQYLCMITYLPEHLPGPVNTRCATRSGGGKPKKFLAASSFFGTVRRGIPTDDAEYTGE
jgi:hypothetical protein